MGWSFGWDSRADMLAYCTGPGFLAPGYAMLESRVVGGHHWYLYSTPEGAKTIGLNLIKGGGRDGWGYKGLDETMGPCEVNCPLALLAKADEPRNDYSRAWREKVRAYHAARKAKPEPETGMRVTYCGHEYRLHTPAGPRKGWHVVRVGDGAMFRMRAHQLSQALMGA